MAIIRQWGRRAMFTTVCKGPATTLGRSGKPGKNWENGSRGAGREANLNP